MAQLQIKLVLLVTIHAQCVHFQITSKEVNYSNQTYTNNIIHIWLHVLSHDYF